MAKEYKYIWAWGRMMGSDAFYIKCEIERAKGDNAPQDAIYRNQDGTWVTFAECQNPNTVQQIEQILKQAGY